MVRQASRLRRSHAHLTRPPAEIEIRQVQVAGVFQVHKLLAERIGQAAKAIHERAHRQVVALNVRRAYRTILGGPGDEYPSRPDANAVTPARNRSRTPPTST